MGVCVGVCRLKEEIAVKLDWRILDEQGRANTALVGTLIYFGCMGM